MIFDIFIVSIIKIKVFNKPIQDVDRHFRIYADFCFKCLRIIDSIFRPSHSRT